MRRQLFVGVVFSVGLLSCVQCHAADPADLQGVRVFPKEGCVIRDASDVLDEKSFALPYVVQKVNGKWLLIGDSKKGWVLRSQVVLLEEAPAYYTKVINRKDNGKAWALAKRAVVWEESGQLDLAIADYGERLLLGPDIVAYNNRGSAWLVKKEYDKAIADFDQVIQLVPNVGGVYCKRASAWHAKQDYDKTIADYDQVIRLEPGNSMAYRSRGNAWCAKRECDKAIADFNRAIELDPGDAEAHSSRGNAWNIKKEYDQAIDDFNQAILLSQNRGSAYSDRGDAWYGKKEFGNAIVDYNEAIRLDPTLAHSYNNLAWIFATASDEKYRNGPAAVVLATKACELSGWTNPHRLGTLAAAYAEAGDFENAVKYQQKAVELNPKTPAYAKRGKDRIQLYSAHKPHRE